MTVTVNVHEAKTHFSKLLERVRLGEEVIVAKAGTPVARLVPVETPAKQRQPGSMKGRIRIGDDFDAPLPPDIARAFGIEE
jgi:prevent-host-death family protein